MGTVSLAKLFLLLLLVFAILGWRRFWRLGAQHVDLAWRGLLEELQGHEPAYSAETTESDEAEFIRERLPRRWPALLIALVVVLAAALVWFLTR